MTEIILKIILAIFLWLALPEIICKKWEFKKGTKKFVGISCKIVAAAILVFLVFSMLVACGNMGRRHGKDIKDNIVSGTVVKIWDGDTYDLLLGNSIKTNQVGLWVEHPYVLPPWIVRNLQKQGYKIQEIYKAQNEHLKGKHSLGCLDIVFCETIKTENWYEQK